MFQNIKTHRFVWSQKKNIPSFWGKIYILITSKHSEFFGQTKAARMSATNTNHESRIQQESKNSTNHWQTILGPCWALKLHDGTAKIAKKQPKKRKSERKNENVTTLNKVRFATTEVEECEWTTECSKHCSLLSLVMPAWFERRKEYSPITSWWCLWFKSWPANVSGWLHLKLPAGLNPHLRGPKSREWGKFPSPS